MAHRAPPGVWSSLYPPRGATCSGFALGAPLGHGGKGQQLLELCRKWSDRGALRGAVSPGSLGSPATDEDNVKECPAAHAQGSDDAASEVLGRRLHMTVDKARWCVTSQDLAHFRVGVERAIRHGCIAPTSTDAFDPEDRKIGPTIYTVNEQFIKPITKAAGSMSWALMLHPEGLQCDLFITHAWMEGVFEFVDKVLHSWPHSCRHAYCCMLANPQNLDISDLIGTPRESPFAIALTAANHVLVVPNQTVSVYMRLWCAYEAFLACESDKVVLVAHAERSSAEVGAFVVAAAGACFGLFVGMLHHTFAGGQLDMLDFDLFWVLFSLPFCLSMLIGGSFWRRVCNVAGAAVIAYLGAIADLDPTSDYASVADWRRALIRRRCCYFFMALYYMVAEIDRVRRVTLRSEAKLLHRDYTGTIIDAKCSVPFDAECIRADIGDRVEDVDVAVNVLIQAGMSTTSLRKASEAGVDVKGAAHMEFAILAGFCGVVAIYSDYLYASGNFVCIVLASSIATLLCAWLLMMLVLKFDRRVFAVKAMSKCALIWLCLGLPLHMILRHWELIRTGDASIMSEPQGALLNMQMQAVLVLLMIASALCAGVAGLENVVRIAGGRLLAQWFLARGASSLSVADVCAACCCDSDNPAVAESAPGSPESSGAEAGAAV